MAERARVSAAGQAELLALLRQIRSAGHAEGPGDTMWSIAAPLAEISFSVPLVLGLAGPAERVQANLPAPLQA
jgi:DNA-binding IclR family transcriptional regulator